MFRYIFDADYKFGGLAQVELKPMEGRWICSARTSSRSP